MSRLLSNIAERHGCIRENSYICEMSKSHRSRQLIKVFAYYDRQDQSGEMTLIRHFVLYPEGREGNAINSLAEGSTILKSCMQ